MEHFQDIDRVFIGAVMGFTACLMVIAMMKQVSIWRGATAMRADREAELKDMIGQGMCDVMIDLRREGKMDVVEFKYWSNLLSNIFSIHGLIPKGQKVLKERIAMRLATDYKTKPKFPELDKEIAATAPKKVAEAKKSIVELLKGTSEAA